MMLCTPNENQRLHPNYMRDQTAKDTIAQALLLTTMGLQLRRLARRVLTGRRRRRLAISSAPSGAASREAYGSFTA